MSEPAPPPGPDHEPLPPFAERPPIAELWRRARQDYLGGDTARAVCVRYGLSERTFYSRASREGWRRVDAEASINDGPPAWSTRTWRRSCDIIAEEPEFAEVQSAKDNEAYRLLFDPRTDHLRAFAFNRACEAAVVNRPSEAAGWLRVQRLAEQCRPVGDPHYGDFTHAERLRAEFIRALDADTGLDEDALDHPDGPRPS